MTLSALPWLLRAAWAALPFVAGPALAGALDGWAGATRTAASAGLWAGWAVVLVATLVAHPICLTILRVGAPAGAVASIASAATGHGAAALLLWVLLLGLVFAPETGMWFVNGAAYPNERRFPLRPPGPLLLGPLPLAWAATAAGPPAGVLLLAAEQWVAGALVLAVGLALAFVLGRSLHTLSRRWLVFVPAGVVIHDDLALADPVLVRRQVVGAIRPAPASTDALDLTQRALGLAVEIDLTEPVSLTLTEPGNRAGRSTSAAALLVTPTRPGTVLVEAAKRRIGAR
jgi:hypothetical protein